MSKSNTDNVKIILTGAAGRMGHAVSEAVKADNRFTIVAGVDIAPTQAEFPIYVGIEELSADIGADVIIDFSHHSAVEGILKYAESAGCAAIICSTGHTDEEKELMLKASERIPVFYSRNMSIGINLLISLVKKAASTLEGFDIEIVEKHHHNKLDAPSGTALMLAEAAANSVDYEAKYVYDRHSVRQKRATEEIGIHSIRGGSIVGEHDVIFAGTDEVITLSHSASSREVFAAGALRAAYYMKGKGAGMYDMENVIASSTDNI